ncbi:MAG TPA: signal peptidase II [Candidatus Acidoferrales bacterium]|nr:signal peptidase II [Candidatus Acidoferrales bacterium]
MSPKIATIALVFASTVVLDQLSKIVVDRTLPLHVSIPVIENFFNLTYIRNKGAAFGMLANSPETFRLAFLLVFSVTAIGFLIVALRRLPASERALTVALSLILGGAIGNLIDRFLYGEVIDFLDFHWSGYHWPAFNLADSFITIGVGLALCRLATAKDEDPFAPKKDRPRRSSLDAAGK